jgi:hypothetical protein
VVAGVVGENLRVAQPHLVDLRRVLDEVAGHRGAGEHRILHVGEQAVQRVPELVEQGAHVVDREQRRLPVGGARQVERVEHHRLRAQQPRLRDERVHPRPAALRLTRVEVGDEEPELPVLVEDVENPDLGVVAGQVVALAEPHPVEAARGVEDTVVQHALQLEVGPQRAGIEVEAFTAHTLGVERPVPRLDGVPGRGRQLVRLGLSVGRRHGSELSEHRVDRIDRARRADLDHPGRMVRVPEQLGALGAQLGHAEHDLAGVVLPAEPTRDRRAMHPLAQLAGADRGEYRLSGRQHERDQVGTVVATCGGRPRGGRAGVRGEPGELRGILDENRPVVRPGQELRAELRGESRQLRVERPQPLLLGGPQSRPGPDGIAMAALQQPERLGVQAEIVARREKGLDAGEQRRIEHDRVRVRCELRGDLGLDGADPLGAARADECEEHRRDPPQHRTRTLQRGDRVAEGCRTGIGGDLHHLGALLLHSRRERRQEVLLTNGVEVGKLEGQRARAEERVGAHAREHRSVTEVRVGVGAVLVEGGRVLVMRRAGAHGAGLWGLPGGHQEFGESPERTRA